MKIGVQSDDSNTSGESDDSNNPAAGDEMHYNVDCQGDECVSVKTVTSADASCKSTGTSAIDDLNKPTSLAGSHGENMRMIVVQFWDHKYQTRELFRIFHQLSQTFRRT